MDRKIRSSRFSFINQSFANVKGPAATIKPMTKHCLQQRMWLMLLFLFPLFSYAYEINISGYSSFSSYNNYPLFEIIQGDKTSIIISSTGGQFDYVYLDEQQVEYNTTSYWSSYTLDISNCNDGKTHKLQLKRSSSDYGICYFSIRPLLSFYVNIYGNYAYLSSAAKSITVADIPAEYEYNGQTYPVTEISSEAFKDCTALTTVKFPESIKRIGQKAFYNCKSLTSITIPESVEFIGQWAFDSESGSQLREVIFNAINCNTPGRYNTCPDSDCYCWTIANIFPKYALTNITIGDKVTKIPYGIFQFCDISSINIPGSVKTIQDKAFYYCNSLTSIDIPESVTEIGTAFDECRGLQKVNFGSIQQLCTMSISRNPLVYAKDLYIAGNLITDLVIPSTVTKIRSRSFDGCKSITSLIIPASVNTIEYYAFYGCTNLKSVTCLSDTPPSLPVYYGVGDCGGDLDLDDHFPPHYSTTATLYVPLGTADKYQYSGWSTYFRNIVEVRNILTVQINGNGTVYRDELTPIATGTKYIGSDFSFIILPDDGYHVESITLEGKDITSELKNHTLNIADFKGEEDGRLNIVFAPDSEASLTIKSADNHSMTHTHKDGTSATIEFKPEEDWKIHSVTFNGEDVTDQLQENKFITGPLHGNNFLNMVLINDTPTEINAVNSPDNKVRILINDHKVTIQGLNDDEPVSVYDATGRTIYTGFERTLSLSKNTVYLVSTPSKTFKIAL